MKKKYLIIGTVLSAVLLLSACNNTETNSTSGIGDAPLTIAISCVEGSELSAGLAVQNMSAEAQLLGYGTKIMTAPTMALNSDEYGSSGLGLSMVKSIIELHGGTITVKSTPGQGSEFRIVL